MFPQIGVPQIIHFNRVFHFKPSILGYPYFWKPPFGNGLNVRTPKLAKCDSNDVNLHLKKVCYIYIYLMYHTFDFPYMAMGSLLEYKIQDGTYLKQLFGVGSLVTRQTGKPIHSCIRVAFVDVLLFGSYLSNLGGRSFSLTNSRCFGLTKFDRSHPT